LPRPLAYHETQASGTRYAGFSTDDFIVFTKQPQGEREANGWLQKDEGGRFASQTDQTDRAPELVASGRALALDEAVQFLLNIDPEYVVHNSPDLPAGGVVRRDTRWEVLEPTPQMRERVRRLIEDPQSGEHLPLHGRKIEYWMGSFPSVAVGCYVLRLVLQYGEPRQSVCEALAPVVGEA